MIRLLALFLLMLSAPAPARAAALSPIVLDQSMVAAVLLALGVFVLFCLVFCWRIRRARDLAMASIDVSGRARQLIAPNGRVVFTNAAYRRIFPEPDKPVIETLLAQIAPGSGGEALLRQMMLTAGQGGRARGDIEVINRNGEHEWLDISAQPLRKMPKYIFWGVELITTQRQIEEFIRSDHEQFADLLENAPIGFYSVNEKGAFLFINATLAAGLGLDPGAPVAAGASLKLHDLVEPKLPPGTPAYSPFADPDAKSGEVTLRGPNNRAFQAFIRHEVVAVLSSGGAGKLRTRSVVHDLTREQALEEALKVSEQYFKRFFEEAPTGIALLDHENRFERANTALQKLLECACDPGCALIDCLAQEDRLATEAYLSRVREGARADFPLTVRLAGEKQRSVTIFASRRDTAGQRAGPPGCIAHFIDATEQKRLEVQFAQSQRMQAVGLLAGGIAHDFNNLLTAMIGFCDLLLLRHRPGDQSFADIMQIKQNANRAANLVRQLLAFSRQQTLQPRVLSLTDVLAELSHLLRRLIGENIELTMVHGRDLWPVRADHGQLEQVIINLAVNARDAMPGGGRLSIRTANVETEEPMQRGADVMPPGPYVLIEIADTGSGIPAEIQDRIFEPFFSTKAVGSGTGLGLSTVYGIVRQTGGYIFFDSQAGKGTVFRLYLPQYARTAEISPHAEHAEDQPRDLTGIGTILLVEDEDAVRLFSARALRNKGYRVLEARSGDAAIEIVNEHLNEIDLVISDVVMPRMDGPTLVAEIRNRRPDMRVIFISGYAEDAFRKRIDSEAEAHFLLKPFTLKQLAAKVKEALG